MKNSKKVVKKPAAKKEKINKKIAAKKLINEYLEKRNNKVIVGNWKTHMKFKEIKQYASEFNMLIKNDKVLKKLNFVVGIAPTMLGLLPASGLMGKHVAIVSQHAIPYTNGTFTGQVAYDQVHEYNVNYGIVGHSEVRRFFNVDDTFCRDCIRTYLKAGMRPILCVGDNKQQFDEKKSKKVVMLQLMNCLKELTEDEIRQVIIAYEPIWAIGQKVAAHEWIVDMTKFIRKSVADLYDAKTAKEVHVLYGGSVTPANSRDILSINGIDGVLVGGSSLKANKFYEIICSAPEYIYAASILYPPKKGKKA